MRKGRKHDIVDSHCCYPPKSSKGFALYWLNFNVTTKNTLGM